MTLITLLIVLTIERVSATAELWQFDFYYQKMKSLMVKHLGKPDWLRSSVGRWGWVLLPVLVIAFLSRAMDWLILAFIFDVLVLLICIGCIKQRRLYKSFLNAATRGDEQACQRYAAQMQGLADILTEESAVTESNIEEPIIADPTLVAPEFNYSLGQTLVWFNFRYYCAVLFWFVALGPAGAVLYCMVRESADDTDPTISELFNGQQLQQLLHLLDWLPVRICSAGYLLIGNFSRAAGIWLSYLLDFSSPAQACVTEIANAAETIEASDGNEATEPVCMLKLAKRNVLFFLALVALLTLYGAVQ